MRTLVGLSVVALLIATSLAAPEATDVIKNGMGPVHFLRFSPNGKELVRICDFGGVELFDTDGYDKMRTFPTGMRMVAYSADGTRIATAEGTDGARIWDAALPGKVRPRAPTNPIKATYLLDVPLKVLETPHGGGNSRDVKTRVFWAEFSPDGKRVVTTQASGHVKVWDTATWTVESDIALTNSEVRAAAFAPDGKTLEFGDVDGSLYEWNFEKKAGINKAGAEGCGAVTGIVFSPDGKTLVTTYAGRSGMSVAVVWEVGRAGVEVKPGLACAAFSPDGKTLALGDTGVELFDVATKKSVRVVELVEMSARDVMPQLAADHADDPDTDRKIPVRVCALSFSPDGATLAAGCQDGSVRLIKTKSGR